MDEEADERNAQQYIMASCIDFIKKEEEEEWYPTHNNYKSYLDTGIGSIE